MRLGVRKESDWHDGVTAASNPTDQTGDSSSDHLRQPDNLLKTNRRFTALRPRLTTGLPLSCAIVTKDRSRLAAKFSHLTMSNNVCQRSLLAVEITDFVTFSRTWKSHPGSLLSEPRDLYWLRGPSRKSPVFIPNRPASAVVAGKKFSF